MRTWILAAATVSIALAGSFSAFADDVEEIRQLIPSATSISQRDYKLIGGELKGLADFEQQSLTAALLTMRPSPNPSKEATEAFQNDGPAGITRPAFLREIYRQPQDAKNGRAVTSPITWFHADRITDFTCKVSGDTAKGTVSFKVPEQVKGKFEYVAERKGGKWRVTTVSMPARGIHLVCDEHDKWHSKSSKGR